MNPTSYNNDDPVSEPEDEEIVVGWDLAVCYLPHANDFSLATDVAVSAVEDDPSVDLDCDEQELLATTFLQMRTWFEWMHKLARAEDISGADFFQLYSESMDRAGFSESWRDYRREPDVDPAMVGEDHPLAIPREAGD